MGDAPDTALTQAAAAQEQRRSRLRRLLVRLRRPFSDGIGRLRQRSWFGRSADDPEELTQFTYADPEDSWVRRCLIQTIEFLTGQQRLRRIYLTHHRHPVPGESFWNAAVRLLKLDVRYNEAALAAVPRDGPLVIVANHPYGVLDGLVIGWLSAKVRDEYKILTNGVLYRAPLIRPWLLPIDFRETKEAMQVNLRTRAEARAILARGGCIVVFPGGTVSTAMDPWGPATDPDWKPFTARLVIESKATVVPIFFEGQNSRLFQLASHSSQTLRLALLFRETARRIGTPFGLRIGRPLPFAELAHLRDRKELAQHLRLLTYRLGGIENVAPWTTLPTERAEPREAT